ncbi:contact-dependent growth inhibition system immunity protein [Deinococcus sp. YIM 134068]|uniref:contact-dependent growth inhibition system immunity protein n=1 Tax=Deinococcus lichenicola TaxID=3118910 RepID=UPI003FA4BEB4
MPKGERDRRKKRREVDVGQSLAQLHHLLPLEPSSFRSGLIIRCERLLITPLRQFEPGDLRVMLHQRFYPETLVPLALPLLEGEPLLAAELYPGDLLSSVLHQTADFWSDSPDLFIRTQAVADQALLGAELFESTRRDIEDFKARTGPVSR